MQSLDNWHALAWERCLEMLQTSERGLKSAEVARRVHEHGPNQLAESDRVSPWVMFLNQFRDFMIVVLLVATLISAVLGEFADALTIIAIVLVNAVLGFVQEYRAERAIDALKDLTAPQVEVVRDGYDCTVDVRELVPGDVVRLKTGDRVPADMRVISSMALEADEAALTGESLPVRKTPEPVAVGTLLADRVSMLYAGTLISRGHGTGVVTSTGMETEVGRIAELLQNTEREPTPLQSRLEQLGKYIVCACLAICAAVVVLGIMRGENPAAMFLAGVSLAVAAIPEGLPAIVTIALAIGVQRMIRVNAIVRKLPAVETLGCSTVICSDKTGTLTKNAMTVRSVWLPGGEVDVTGEGYSQQGELLQGGTKISLSGHPQLAMCLQIAVLCNNARIEQGIEHKGILRRSSTWKIKGDPTEAALLIAGAKAGVVRDRLGTSLRVLDEIPFDSVRKRMSILVEDTGGRKWSYCKGAPDVLLERCSHYYDGSEAKVLDKMMRNHILARVESMGGSALRVLAVAYRPLPTHRTVPDVDEMEVHLVFAGLFGMIDPPRPEAKAALRTCATAGIRAVMITGDHATTAGAIGRELGLIGSGGTVITGEQLNRMSEHELEQAVKRCQVFARVSPHHKLEIVRILKKAGHTVAMTGDGINDAPALMEADIGVAMGQGGTDVAKEASALILSDDNFATIVSAVREGRAIYDNIRKFIRYLLACNVGELLTVFLTMLLRMPLPLKPIQILWVNLVTDGLPAMALGVDVPDRDLMLRMPRPKAEGVFARGLSRKIMTRGVLIGITTTAVFTLALLFSKELVLARTMAFATLVYCQLFHVFDCRSETMGILEKGLSSNLYLIGAVTVSSLMFLAVLYIPSLRILFNTAALSYRQWAIVLLASGLPTMLVGVRRVIRYQRRRLR